MSQSDSSGHRGVRQVCVKDEDAGQRIDNFLTRHLRGVPKSHIYRILRRGEVRVNSGRIRAQYKVQAGDTVRIPPVRIQEKQAGGHPGFDVERHIVFENERCLVLNKPAGLAVHGGSGVSAGAIEALRAGRPDAPFLELVHRLDRETSGCLLVAKRRSFLRALHEQLRSGLVTKQYLALVRGRWEGGERRVEAPLLKNRLSSGERVVRVSEQGRPALSVFRPLSRFGIATLVEVELHTGRTHQIRVHAAHSGFPIAGDGKYGSRSFNRLMREAGLRRMFLHAHRLAFADPADGAAIDISAPLDSGLKAVLDRLEEQVNPGA